MRRLTSKALQTETKPPRPIPGLRLVPVAAALALLATMYTVALLGAVVFYLLCAVAVVEEWAISRRTASKKIKYLIREHIPAKPNQQWYNLPN